ncbi:MAG: beta-propeller fold lactonase family protein, partial [Candidatus Portiera sp.]|nr:beta-propeller fold lactonase family protein [Portiera sp.]
EDILYELDAAVAVETAVIDGKTYLFVAGAHDDGVSVFQVKNNGNLVYETSVTDDYNTLLVGARNLAITRIGDSTYLFVTGQNDDALNVFRVDVDTSGLRLNHVDSVQDDNTLELDTARYVQARMIGGLTYLFVAGSMDDGVSVFLVNDDGSLSHVTRVQDTLDGRLNDPNGIAIAEIGGALYLFVAAFTDNAVSVFAISGAVSGGTLPPILSVPEISSVGAATTTSLRIAWGQVADATHYRVYQNNIRFADNVTDTSYTDMGLNPDTNYIYRIAACNANVCSAQSRTFRGRTLLPAPAMPNISSVENATSTSLIVSWGSVAYATHYRVYRNNSIIESSSDATNYIDTGLIINTSYSYRVDACNNIGCSAQSDAVSGRTLMSGTPGTPITLEIPTISSVVSPTPISLNVSWGSVADATHYQVYRNNSRIESRVAAAIYTDRDLIPNTNYSYAVAACNLNSCSARSEEVSGRTLAFALNNVFNVNQTSGGADYKLDGAFGVTTTVVANNTYLLVASFNDASLSVFLANANGSLTLTDTVVDTDDPSYILNSALDVEVLTLGDDTYVYVAANSIRNGGVTGFKLVANGTLSEGFGYPDDASVNLARALSITNAVVDSTPYIFVTGFNDDGISVFRVTTDGTNKGRLNHVFSVSDIDSSEYSLDGVGRIETAVIAGKTYLFVSVIVDNSISVFEVMPNGELVHETSFIDDDNTLLDGVQNVATTRIGPSTYLFSNAFADGAVNVFRVDNTTSGLRLNHVDSVQDDDDLELMGTRYMQPRVIGDLTYLFVSGEDDNGVSVFLVNDDGSLSHVTSLQDTPEVNLDAPNGIALAEISGSLYLFVAASIDDGISVFEINNP